MGNQCACGKQKKQPKYSDKNKNSNQSQDLQNTEKSQFNSNKENELIPDEFLFNKSRFNFQESERNHTNNIQKIEIQNYLKSENAYSKILKSQVFTIQKFQQASLNPQKRNVPYKSGDSQKKNELQAKNTGQLSQKIQKRLQNEVKVMAKNLPVNSSNSIFICQQENNVQNMHSIIIGAENTPYSNGIFLFDIQCNEHFPTSPPIMNILTTGGSIIRFNPNLYNSGFICLSIIGTWNGNKNETWDETKSSIYQVLVSIQSLVMTEGVLYKEPGFEQYRSKQSYQLQNTGYENIVRYGNIKYAMNEMLKSPPKEFEKIIKTHFYLNKQKVTQQVSQWIDTAKSEASMYSATTQSHNSKMATKFSSKKDAYKNELLSEYKILKDQLESLKLNMIKDIDFVKTYFQKLEQELAKKKRELEQDKQQQEDLLKQEKYLEKNISNVDENINKQEVQQNNENLDDQHKIQPIQKSQINEIKQAKYKLNNLVII